MNNKESASAKKPPRGSKTIRISCDEESYKKALESNQGFRDFLAPHIELYSELFPEAIAGGYSLYGKGRKSKKLDKLQFQKIKIIETGEIFRIHPSYVMPYLIAYTKDVEHALLLRKHDVPYSTLVYIFGKDEMFWYRAEQAFSKCSIVGTTVKKKSSCRKTLQLMKSILSF